MLKEELIKLTKNNITIIDATPAQEELYRNLVNLQFHDLSEFRDNFDILEDGRFEWNFAACFTETNQHHHPLLIMYKERVVGFLIFSKYKSNPQKVDFMLVEMFILKMYRNKGIGKQAIELIFENYKGKYHLDVAESNMLALNFWESLINSHSKSIVKKPFEDEGNSYVNYIFEV